MLPSITQKANLPARTLLERLEFRPLYGGDLFETLEITDAELLYLKRRPDA
jgi:hypothetical protein